MIIVTSDHAWRFDSKLKNRKSDICHVPLFIKFPHQNTSVDVTGRFFLFTLGPLVNRYLDRPFDYNEVNAILADQAFSVFKPKQGDADGDGLCDFCDEEDNKAGSVDGDDFSTLVAR
jgi:hypothetical protein